MDVHAQMFWVFPESILVLALGRGGLFLKISEFFTVEFVKICLVIRFWDIFLHRY